MKLNNFTRIGSLLVILIVILTYCFKPATKIHLLILFINLEGTVLLAGSISVVYQNIGDGFWGKLKWLMIELPKYSSTASINLFKFYLGVFFLFIAYFLNSLLI